MLTQSCLNHMSVWDSYPPDYRANEIQTILSAVQSGECAEVVGLSGAGKSNLLGFLAQRVSDSAPPFVLVDCNRLSSPTPAAFFRLVRISLERRPDSIEDEWWGLEEALKQRLDCQPHAVCLLLDRFDALPETIIEPIYGSLRALRDTFKYQLTYVTASRHPVDTQSELAELFYAHTIWLGPLSASDARNSIERYVKRKGIRWSDETIAKIIDLSWGYPSFLRAICEAHSAGAALQIQNLVEHPALRQRLDEFWAGAPSAEDLRNSRLDGHPLLSKSTPPVPASVILTAKENRLLEILLEHTGALCEKDALIRAVWSEDKVFEESVRDDSLAQLVHRLRHKLETLKPTYHIQAVTGRGYRLVKED